MGKTKKSQFFFGLIIGILVWVSGIIITGFLPTFGDGIEFGYRSALTIIFPAVLWVICIFFGIKTAKNGKTVFFYSYTAVLLIPVISMLLTLILGVLEDSTGEEVFDKLAGAASIMSVPFIGSVIYGADIAFSVLYINVGANIFATALYILYAVIAASAPIAGIVAKKAYRNAEKMILL